MSDHKILEHVDKVFFKSIKKFPNRSNRIKTFIYLTVANLYLFFKKIQLHGQFSRKVSALSLFAWKSFAKYNPFNYGEYVNKLEYFGFDYFDNTVIKKLLNLYKAEKNTTGMVVSSATEGNMYAMWMGREMFYRKGIKNVKLVTSDLTDESVKKSAQIMNIPLLKVEVDNEFGMSAISLTKNISNEARANSQIGFIVCLTIGYKKTATSDDYKKLTKCLQKLKSKHSNINFYVWIDSASEGLIKPIVEKFVPFSNRLIQAVVFDTHKILITPHTVGIILINRNLVNKNKEFTNGILESRSSLPAIALWSSIQGLGKKGILDQLTKSNKMKQYFLKRIVEHVQIIKLISPKSSFSVALKIKKTDLVIFRQVERFIPLRINSFTINNIQHHFVKLYFFPDLKMRQIELIFKRFR